MAYINRKIKMNIIKRLVPGQAVVLYGARRVGKTTFIEHLMQELGDKVKFINAENAIQRAAIETENFYQLEQFLKNFEYLIIDEAQKISHIGDILKIIVDNIPNIKVLVTGSASFELANQVGEPLTGRKRTLSLYPIAISEIYKGDVTEVSQQLEERLIFGSYPKVYLFADDQDKKEELHELVDAYLYRDILTLENIRNADKIRALLVLLAFQVGSEISFSELAKQLGMSMHTVSRYLDLLEKVFVIFKLSGFSRNLRKEVSKNHKYYFYDNGVRNTLINNFNQLSLRDDIGKLWENFVMSERIKTLNYNRDFVNRYFWRTYDQKEIDLIEEKDGVLHAYEFKYKRNKVKVPKDFLEAYPDSTFKVISQENYMDFLIQS